MYRTDNLLRTGISGNEYTLISSPTGVFQSTCQHDYCTTVLLVLYSIYKYAFSTGNFYHWYQVEEVQNTNGALSFSSTSSPGTHSNAQRDALYTELPMLLLPSSTTGSRDTVMRIKRSQLESHTCFKSLPVVVSVTILSELYR
jgi:hypothetical protein